MEISWSTSLTHGMPFRTKILCNVIAVKYQGYREGNCRLQDLDCIAGCIDESSEHNNSPRLHYSRRKIYERKQRGTGICCNYTVYDIR